MSEMEAVSTPIAGGLFPARLSQFSVRLKTSPGLQPCPVYEIIVSGAGTGIYNGIDNAPVMGMRCFSLQKADVERIVRKIVDVKLLCLPRIMPRGERLDISPDGRISCLDAIKADELPYADIWVRMKSAIHRVMDYTPYTKDFTELKHLIENTTGLF